ncbi:MAG: hypothetical protein ACP5H7_02615 [Minisyncoccia bacterium]
MLILIKGGMFQGKSSLAKKIQTKNNFPILSLSEPLKKFIIDLLPMKYFNLWNLHLTYEGDKKGYYIRKIYQQLGDEIKEKFGEKFFVILLLSKIIQNEGKAIVDDIRTQKEIFEITYMYRSVYKSSPILIDVSLDYRMDEKKLKDKINFILQQGYTKEQLLEVLEHNSEKENWDIKKIEKILKEI